MALIPKSTNKMISIFDLIGGVAVSRLVCGGVSGRCGGC